MFYDLTLGIHSILPQRFSFSIIPVSKKFLSVNTQYFCRFTNVFTQSRPRRQHRRYRFAARIIAPHVPD